MKIKKVFALILAIAMLTSVSVFALSAPRACVHHWKIVGTETVTLDANSTYCNRKKTTTTYECSLCYATKTSSDTVNGPTHNWNADHSYCIKCGYPLSSR